MAEIQMPQLGETVTEGTITKWLKAVGEEISEDEALVEVSTDKVDSEVPSPVSGTLTEIKVAEGDTVDVGTVLAVVGDAGSGGAEAPAGVSDQASGAGDEAPAAGDEGDQAVALEQQAEREIDAATEPEASPAPPTEPAAAAESATTEPAADEADQAAQAAAEAGDDDPQAPPAAQPLSPAGAGDASSPGGQGSGGPVLSPVVRRLIAEHGLDPAALSGTGAGGRITRNDVLTAVEGGQAPVSAPAASAGPAATPGPAPAPTERAPAAAPAPAARPAATGPRATPARAGGADETVPFNNIRRRTGEHMVRSLATAPHAYTVMEVDLEGVERVRRAHKERLKAEAGISLTYLPFIARALVDALDEFPHMNASVGEGELVIHHDINLGIAVDLDREGLIVPVVRSAQDLRLPAIARSVADLADKARSRQLSADDITGGTVTITNVGSTGNLLQLPIINQPQVMILSTDGVARRPVVVTDDAGNEAIAIRSVANLTLGWDHRAFDGAYAAAFLRRLVDILEQRDWQAEL